MIKLTKTEQAILDKARYGRVGAECCYGRGPEGGRIQEGSRQTAAFRKLVEKGLVKNVKKSTTTLPKGGYTIWVVGYTGEVA